MSLYQRIGGEEAVNQAVDLFYSKVLVDDRVNEFFDFVDMPAQIQKQKYFLSMAFEGPDKYSGKDMREAHKHMNLTDTHFEAIVDSLFATLTELSVPSDAIDEVLKIVMSVKDEVLNK